MICFCFATYPLCSSKALGVRHFEVEGYDGVMLDDEATHESYQQTIWGDQLH